MKMKQFAAILLALATVFALAACAGSTGSTETDGNIGSSQNAGDPSVTPSETENESDASDETPSEPADGNDGDTAGGKILVAYFSATNNTEGIAQKLADGLGADLYEITPETPYTDADLDYGSSKSRSSIEMNDPSARPAISGSVENMDQYDVVFIGQPNFSKVNIFLPAVKVSLYQPYQVMQNL